MDIFSIIQDRQCLPLQIDEDMPTYADRLGRMNESRVSERVAERPYGRSRGRKKMNATKVSPALQWT